MQPYSKDPINYLRNKFDKWYYSQNFSGQRQKRGFLMMLLTICVIVLVLLPLISEEMAQRTPLIFVVIAIALINLGFLLYENFTDPEGRSAAPLSIF